MFQSPRSASIQTCLNPQQQKQTWLFGLVTPVLGSGDIPITHWPAARPKTSFQPSEGPIKAIRQEGKEEDTKVPCSGLHIAAVM